jgi:hypothetical protein
LLLRRGSKHIALATTSSWIDEFKKSLLRIDASPSDDSDPDDPAKGLERILNRLQEHDECTWEVTDPVCETPGQHLDPASTRDNKQGPDLTNTSLFREAGTSHCGG